MLTSLALTEVSVVSVKVMRLMIFWSVASDQFAVQPGPRNCGSTSADRKAVISLAVIDAAAGSSLANPKRARKAASNAALDGDPAAVKSSIGFTSVLVPAKTYSPLKLVF